MEKSGFLALPVYWSTEDFEKVAKELEEGGSPAFNRREFKTALETMVKDHDATIGINFNTIEVYLREYCTPITFTSLLLDRMAGYTGSPFYKDPSETLYEDYPMLLEIRSWRDKFNLTMNGNGTKEQIKLASSLIKEEYEELTAAIRAQDPVEVLDALIDILFVCYQLLDCTKSYNNTYARLEPSVGIYLWGVLTDFINNPSKTKFSGIVSIIIRTIGSEELTYEAVKEVCKSNMSKSSPTINQASMTEDKYKKLGVETYSVGITPSLYITYRKSDNKVLKSINFKEPNLKDLAEEAFDL